MKVYKAINAITAALAQEGISKDRRNQAQGFNFRGIDQVYDALSTKLAQHSLCIIPRVVARECVERQSGQGKTLVFTTLTVEYDVISAEDGSKHVACVVGEAMDSGDKSTNKAMSAAYKYLCLQLFCIPVEGQPDADAETHHPVGELDAQAVAAIRQKVRACKTTKDLDDLWQNVAPALRNDVKNDFITRKAEINGGTP